MTIAPIIQRVEVKCAPAKAFTLFSSRMADWWPRGKTVGKQPHAEVVMEPHVDGRWFERDADGNETQWGKVLAWEPPRRLLLGWQLGPDWQYDPEFLTELELTFVELPSGGTGVTLEHRDLERFGALADKRRSELNGGWPTRIADFAAFADAED
jgi:uncharacterized protein YndB with AHSA1/START domain